MYGQVYDAIKAGDITVIVSPEMVNNGTAGLYFSEAKIDEKNIWYDFIALRSSDGGQTVTEVFAIESTIVHECTHAAFDMLKVENMNHHDDEMGAYIAGAIYQVQKMVLMGGHPERVKNFGNPIPAAAWTIALNIVGGTDVPRQMYNALAIAICNDPHYMKNASTSAKNDGVGHKWLINGVREK